MKTTKVIKKYSRFLIIFTLIMIMSEGFLWAAEAEKNSPRETQKEWLAVFLNKKKIGYMTFSRTVSGGRVKTITSIKMKITRMGTTISSEDYNETVETLDGKPISFISQNTGAGSDIKIEGTIRSDGSIKAIYTMAGRKESKTIPWPKGALMPEGNRIIALKKGLREGTTYRIQQFSAATLSTIPIEVKVGKKETIKLLGTTQPLITMTFTYNPDGEGFVIKSHVTDEQMLKKMNVPLMGLEMEIIACSREYALSTSRGGEFFDSVLVSAPRKLTVRELLKGISYRVRLPDEGAFFSVSSTAEQKIKAGKQNSEIILQVIPVNMPKGSPWKYEGSDDTVLTALKPAKYIQSDDREIKALSRLAVGSHKDPAVAARAIEHFVNSYITKKNLTVGYASALDVLKSREGDCTEHAVLTAALCRAAGIPARIVVGIVYSESYPGRKRIFIPHAWTQVYIKGNWYSLDAALGSFAAGHIALHYSNGDPLEFLSLIKILGTIKIAGMEKQ